MEDREVGELWWFYKPLHDKYALDVIDLIRKLVEERAIAYGGTPDDDQTALHDFDIDPKDW